MGDTVMLVTEKTIELFQERKIFTLNGPMQRIKVGDMIFVSNDANIEAYCGILAGIGLFSIGTQSYTWSAMLTTTVMGRYSSLASDIRFMQPDHPISNFTTSPIAFNQHAAWVSNLIKSVPDFSFYEKPLTPLRPTIIGNDVWIGSHVAIKQGIKIGDGAVIGSGALVTKDVPPYAVMGGVPARVIKYRFPEKIIEELLNLKWWDYSFTDFKNMDSDIPIEDFIYRIQNEIAAGRLKKYEPQITTGEEINATSR